MLLLNPYGVDMGTSGLIIQAQSREEIYADKLLAFALRPNSLKFRDLWDILWLHQQGLSPSVDLIPNKLKERNLSIEALVDLFDQRQKLLIEDKSMPQAFKKEMQRFLSPEQVAKTVEQQNLWPFLTYLIGELGLKLRKKSESSL